MTLASLIIAVLQSLARYNPEYITTHLIKDDPDDHQWAIVTLYDELGRKQKIRVQKTPMSIAGVIPDSRALWIQCIEKAAIVLIGKSKDDPCPKYRFLNEKESGGHDYKKHTIRNKSLNLDEMNWGSEELASQLIFGKGRLETIHTRSRNAEDYEEREIRANGRVVKGNYSKTLIDKQGDVALAKALIIL